MKTWFHKLCAVTTVIFVASLYIGQTSHKYAAWDTNNIFTGVNTASNINHHLYVDGTKYTTIQGAFADCGTGCIIDTSGNSTALTLGTFDPGTTPVTVILGPYTYTIHQWTVRSGENLIGQGHLTTLIYQDTNNIAPFVLPSTGNKVANGVHFEGFNLNAAASSTTDGFSFVAAATGGLWYSYFVDITIGAAVPFGRNQIRIDSTNAGSPPATNQFLFFQNVDAFRAQNGQPVLYITGAYSGQMTFQTCQFDGNLSANDTAASTNIQIDDGGSTVWQPYSILFANTTSQWASYQGGAAITLGGVEGVQFIDGHFENDNGLVIAALTGHHGNAGIVLDGFYMATNVAVNSTHGFLTKTDSSSHIYLTHGIFNATPDNYWTGTSTQFVESHDHFNSFGATWSGAEKSITYTVSTLPSAASVGVGMPFIVTDANSFTVGTCTGGGSDYMIAVSNGSTWSCH